MSVILCSASDVAAVWAATGLRRLGAGPVELVLADELVARARWSHRVTNGVAVTRLTLHDHRVLDDERVRGVLNRLVGLPAAPLAQLPPADQAYALEELTALVGSWLLGLHPPVLNRPSPAWLLGGWRRTAEWRLLAAHAGLAALPWRATTAAADQTNEPTIDRGVLVLGDRCIPEPPNDIAAALDRLRVLSAIDTFEAQFVVTDDAWQLVDVDPLPPFQLYGPAALEGLARLLGATG